MNDKGEIRNDVSNNIYNKNFMKIICNIIKDYGIENYKVFLDNYNKKLELVKETEQFLTPEEIINLYKHNYQK